jgi:hypothetical protein
MIWDVHPGSGFFPIPNPGVKKAPDFGSGSATLVVDPDEHRSLSFEEPDPHQSQSRILLLKIQELWSVEAQNRALESR